jgi:hypothetical protein
MVPEASTLSPLKPGTIAAKYEVSFTESALKDPLGVKLFAMEDPPPLNVLSLDAAIACNDMLMAANIISDTVFIMFIFSPVIDVGCSY